MAAPRVVESARSPNICLPRAAFDHLVARMQIVQFWKVGPALQRPSGVLRNRSLDGRWI
jgi:hypothetical protein